MPNSDENDELDEAQLRDLVLWRGINWGELRSKVFAKAEPGSVTCSEKDAAIELIAACLQPAVATDAARHHQRRDIGQECRVRSVSGCGHEHGEQCDQ